MSTPLTRFAVGCMTGTSLDGLDVALARLVSRGRELTARFIAHHSEPLPDPLRATLQSFATGQPHPPIDYLRAARELGQLHATAVAELCQQHLPRDAALAFVAAHGQTICHTPAEHLSWQLFDPWPLVRKLNAPVVYDLRQADLIAHGEGAPITPLADWVMYRDPEQSRFIVNLGGVCNITALPADGTPDRITGGDVGLCNLLIDGVVQRLYPEKRYDHSGELAAAGRPVQLTDDPWHEALAEADARTLGREQLQPDDIDRLLDRLRPQHTPQDIIATMVDTVAKTVALHTSDVDQPWQIVLAGGGARNPVLVDRIRDHVDPAHEVLLTDDLGIPSEAREAIAFAVLGALCEDGLPITLPNVTGSDNPGVAGTWAG